MFKKIQEKPWYAPAIAICIGVLLYVLLAHFGGIWAGIKQFVGYFRPLILAFVFAYMINPLFKLFFSIFEFVKKPKVRKVLAIVISYIVVILFLTFAMIILIPQLLDSIQTLSANLPEYVAHAENLLNNWGISKTTLDIHSFINTSEGALSNAFNLLSDNIGSIIEASASAGKGVFRVVIAFILSIYLLVEKEVLKTGTDRLLKAAFSPERYKRTINFARKCDWIFSRYIIFNIVDSAIIGILNAILMAIFGMEYVGLISFVIAITNLVPTFGPLVGAVIGALILLMGHPLHALIFIIISLVLQILDGYLIKPHLFGNQLGVSGLWILMGIIVGGNMFGVIGILLAIPVVAVIDYMYRTYLIPTLEEKRGIAPPQDGTAPDEKSPQETPAEQ